MKRQSSNARWDARFSESGSGAWWGCPPPTIECGLPVPHIVSDVPVMTVISSDMTVLMAKYEKSGKDVAVLADRSRTTKDLETGEFVLHRTDALKHIALSDTACLGCAGAVPFSKRLYCLIADREDWLARIDTEVGFEPAREIEEMPSRRGIDFDSALVRLNELIPVARDDVVKCYLELGFTEEEVVGDVTVLLAGRKAGRPAIVRWSQKTGWEPHVTPNSPDTVGSLSWPEEFGKDSMGEFGKKIQVPGKPLPIRIRSAMKYAYSLGVHATDSFTYRLLSRGFDLEEVVPSS